MTAETSRQIVVRMPVSMYQAIEAQAQAEERSMAQIIRFAVRDHLASKSVDCD